MLEDIIQLAKSLHKGQFRKFTPNHNLFQTI